MKKFVSIVSVIAALMIFGGCGMNVQKVQNTSSSDASQVSTASAVLEKDKTSQTEVTTEKTNESVSAVTVKESKTSATEKTTEKTKITKESNSTTASKTETTKPKTEKNTSECTVLIECKTILNNYGKLKESKKEFVPIDGVILKETRIPFKNGETVFDVLKRVCAENGIQLESSFTPAFGNYYVEGIGQIYEKDCGTKSGWTYCVNSVFPNMGSSSYILKNGDKVEWHYTCDNGADVGA